MEESSTYQSAFSSEPVGTNKSKATFLKYMGGEKVPAEICGGIPPLGQLMNALHHHSPIGPFMDILLVCFLMLSEFARMVRVLAQASREEFVSIVKDSRVTNNVLEISADLGNSNAKSKPCHVELATTPALLPF